MGNRGMQLSITAFRDSWTMMEMPDNHKPTAHVESSKSSGKLLLEGEKQKWGRETGFEQPVVFHGSHDQRRYVLSQLDKMEAIKLDRSFRRFCNACFTCKMQQKNFRIASGPASCPRRKRAFPVAAASLSNDIKEIFGKTGGKSSRRIKSLRGVILKGRFAATFPKTFHNTYGWLFDVPREILFPSVRPVPCDIPLPIRSKH
jgi:hypothetical protein